MKPYITSGRMPLSVVADNSLWLMMLLQMRQATYAGLSLSGALAQWPGWAHGMHASQSAYLC
jgi:hypothetical protein